MAKPTVKRYYYASKISEEMAKIIPRAVSLAILEQADNIVAVGTTGNLKASGRVQKISPTKQEVSYSTPYAAAQEYGRPDLDNYTYTSYMGPAFKTVFGQLKSIIAAQTKKAKLKSKV